MEMLPPIKTEPSETPCDGTREGYKHNVNRASLNEGETYNHNRVSCRRKYTLVTRPSTLNPGRLSMSDIGEGDYPVTQTLDGHTCM